MEVGQWLRSKKSGLIWVVVEVKEGWFRARLAERPGMTNRERKLRLWFDEDRLEEEFEVA